MANVEMYRAKVEELIREADITTVSARNIRKKIETHTNTSLDNVKREFDVLVMEIYEKITDEIERAALNGNPTPAPKGDQQLQQQQQQPPVQQSQAAPQGFKFALPPTSFVPPPPPPKPKPKSAPIPAKEVSDDDDDDDDSEGSYSSVEEGSNRNKKAKTSSTSSSKKSSSKPKAKSKSSKKDKDEDKPKKKRKQPVNEDGTPKLNNFNRPMIISDTLYNIIGHYGTVGPSGKVEMSRPEVVKHMWAYIKENNLQSEKVHVKKEKRLYLAFRDLLLL
ncbi:hypothetical protein BGZ80_011315 [Entomortierella chlamydospora]|uniref:DEK-C domain-containing protein n=1 Tax=Entomortierella chlamydospora TaxID=101097 RepID=A0A9P6MTS6_9FUNG|nr:hypothetical protein BGZ80_011315 [Entomortierella chlamydospora]